MDNEFVFSIGEMVKTPFEEKAMVSMMAIDEASEKMIFVKLPGGNECWFREGLLTKYDE